MPEATKPRQRPAPLRMAVIRSERITPHMQRVVLGGPAFEQFAERTNAHTDKYVKLTFLHPASPAQDVLDVDALKATLPQEHRPVVRT